MASGSEPAGGPVESAPRPLTEADLDRAVPAIVRAFAWHEPWGEWALPDPTSRERILTGLVDDDVRGRFLPRGECWTIGGAAVTLWMPPGNPAFAARRGPDEYAIYGERAAAMRAGDELISSMKPEVEHWYLDTIATEPESMRLGLGGRLLDHDLEIRDRHGHACALDTHTADNVAFYERRGFEVTDRGGLPGGGPELSMMYRPPRAS